MRAGGAAAAADSHRVSVYNNDLFYGGDGSFLARAEAQAAAAAGQHGGARPGTPLLAASAALQQRLGATPGSPSLSQASRPSSSTWQPEGRDQTGGEAARAAPPTNDPGAASSLDPPHLQRDPAARPATAPVRLGSPLRVSVTSITRLQRQPPPPPLQQGGAAHRPSTAGHPAADTPRVLQSFAGVMGGAGGAVSRSPDAEGSLGRWGGQGVGSIEVPSCSAGARPSTPSFQPVAREAGPSPAQLSAASPPGSARFPIKAANWQAGPQRAEQAVGGAYPKPPSTAPARAALGEAKPGAADARPADGLAAYGISAAAFVAAAPKSAGQLQASCAALTQAGMLAEARLGSMQDLRRFLLAPGPADKPVCCKIVRSAGGLLRGGTQYTLLLEQEGSRSGSFLAAARKRKGGPGGAVYLLSVDQRDVTRASDGYAGKLRANFVGTEFVLHDGGSKRGQGGAVRCELGAVLYQTNVLGAKGPRKMTALLPKLEAGGQRPLRLAPKSQHDTLLGQYKAYNLSSCVVLRNKPPRWNQAMGAYCLNFGGRVTQASVKNFQLVSVDNMERTILQFGKVAPDVFTMDYAYPMTALQAFALCLSSFASKLATQ